MSCGGSGGSSTTFLPAAPALTAISICAGPPATPAPTPSPGASPTPTPTPVPQCSPVTSASTTVGGQLQFNAQGIFVKNKVVTYDDITDSASWYTLGSGTLFSGGGGVFTGTSQGCDCITAASGGVVSQAVQVAVATPLAACTPCPVLPTPTPTP
jgi:chitinase